MYRRFKMPILSLVAIVATLLGAVTSGWALPPTGPGDIPDYFSTPNWAFSPQLAKFVDPLPGLWSPLSGAAEPADFIPIAVPDVLTFPGSDYYVVDLQQYTQTMHSALSPTTLRGYMQQNLGTNLTPGVPVADLMCGPLATSHPCTIADNNVPLPSKRQYLGPLIVATKNRPVRVKFINNLDPEPAGKLFIPVDTSLMGSGLYSVDYDPVSKLAVSVTDGHFTENRASLHLHGGRTPWISDGTPHQWITPADEFGDKNGGGRFYSQGMSMTNVPDMPVPEDGSQTYYWTNQQSSRLMFYHDHAWGITRLNVYAGEAAGYLITDDMEQALIASGPLAAVGIGTPLVIQDKTFVDPSTILATDPTWDWGSADPVAGAITKITVTAAGTGYTAPMIVTVTGSGSGATAEAVIEPVTGRILGFKMLTRGFGYSTQAVAIGGSGTGATAIATAAAAKPPVKGDLWWPHVYMPAQNPYNPDFSGINAMGRWHYGPWFWPPTPLCGPDTPPPFCVDFIETENIYYDCYLPGDEKLFDPPNLYTTTGPCLNPEQPPAMPGTPNVSWGAEAFLDTMIVNGKVYPTVEVEPTQVRFRVLNASHDRFVNLQLYQAVDKIGYTNPTVAPDYVAASQADLTEVAMVPASISATFPPLDAPMWPTDGREGGVPDPATRGPAFIQIGTEGGFLPAPVLLLNQPVQWNLDPTMFNVGNVLQQRDGGGTVTLGPAERADVIVDFSKYAGKTLILYNDAPTAFPALDPHYDYYTGAPDRTDIGANTEIIPGYGPNIRTVMQIRVKACDTVVNPGCDPTSSAPIDDYNPATLTALVDAFRGTNATGQKAFSASQEPIIVGQKEYGNAAGALGAYDFTFRTTFPYWGVSRISDTVLKYTDIAGVQKATPMLPKAIHDEMGGSFDNYGRMSAKLGLEVPGANANIANFALQNYVDPPTELINAATLSADGVQIWKITHNGVDTHPIHFHLFDVQVVNRVGWDGFIRKPDLNELGWKDTVRISPLEDTIVAFRPIAPMVPFGLPTSIRPLNPEAVLGSEMGFSQIDPATGNALGPLELTANGWYDFGWEYVWHCHILSHEENDMMRSIVFDFVTTVPAAPIPAWVIWGVTFPVVNWTDTTPAASSLGAQANEIGFRIERSENGGAFSSLGTALANQTSYTDTGYTLGTNYSYRVFAYNISGDSAPSNTATLPLPGAPTPISPSGPGASTTPTYTFSAVASATGYSIYLWNYTAGSGSATSFAPATCIAGTCTITQTPALAAGNYAWYVRAQNLTGTGPYSPARSFTVGTVPATPTQIGPSGLIVATAPNYTFSQVSGATSYSIYLWNSTSGSGSATSFVPATCVAGTCTITQTPALAAGNYAWYVRAQNVTGTGPYSPAMSFTVGTVPATPTQIGPSGLIVATAPNYTFSQVSGATSYSIYLWNSTSGSGSATSFVPATCVAGTCTITQTPAIAAGNYAWYVRAQNVIGTGPYSPAMSFTVGTVPATPTQIGPSGLIVATAPNYTFSQVSGATSYSIYLWNSTSGSGSATSFVPATCVAGTCTITQTPALAAGNYAWYVRAQNGLGTGPYSPSLGFTVQ